MIKTFESFNELDPFGEEQWENFEFNNDEEFFDFIKNRTFVNGRKYSKMGFGFHGPKDNAVLIDDENYEHQFGFYSDAVVYRIKHYNENEHLNIIWQSGDFVGEYIMRDDDPVIFKRKNTTKLRNYIQKCIQKIDQ